MPKEVFNDQFNTTVMGKQLAVVKSTAEQQQKIYDEIIKQRLASEKKSYDEIIKLNERQAELERARTLRGLSEKEQLELDSLTKTTSARETELRKVEDKILEARKDAIDLANKQEINSYKRMSAEKRREYAKSVYDSLKADEDRRKLEITRETEKLKKLQEERDSIQDKSGKKYLEKQEEILKSESKLRSLNDAQTKQAQAFDMSNRFSRAETAMSFLDKGAADKMREKRRDANSEKVAAAQEKADANKEKKKENLAKIEEEWAKRNEERAKKIENAKKNKDLAEWARLKLEEKTARENFNKSEEIKALHDEATKADKELLKAKLTAAGDELKGAGKKAIASALNKTADSISDNLNALYGQQGRMQGRLQGSNEDWKKAVSNISWTVGMSGAVSQKNIVAKMVELVDSGVAYNLEMRAFLAETSQNIASTFEAANGTLLRIIRLQQADTTAARLGMEAMLTKLFNTYFEDTSYLTTSGSSDNVAAALLDVSATLPKNDSLELEFTVQKWLGSLYSMGMSNSAVEAIAQGINYLGTGNVTALSGNSALQTLFSMSASRAGGKSYAEMLTTGIDAETTNKLLKSMVEYLAEIAESQTNYVTKSAYADLFGMSITDLSTFSSLTETDISNIFKQSIDYDMLMEETQSQLTQTLTRLNVSQLVDNAIDNAEVGAAQTIGGTAFTYGTWKALSILKEYVGEVKIPGIIGMGTGISSGLDLLNLAQTVMAGMGLIGSLVKGVSSMANGGALNLSAWDYSEYTSRGSGLKILDTGSLTTTSFSEVVGVGGGGGSDIASVSEESGKESAMESAGTTSAEMEEQKEAGTKIYDALAGDTTPTVLSLLQEIDDRLDLGRVFYTAIVGQASSGSVDNILTLSSQVASASMTSDGGTESSSATGNGGTSSTSSNSTGISSKGSGIEGEEAPDLSEIISAAVNESLRAVLSTYEMSGFPVTIRNGGF